VSCQLSFRFDFEGEEELLWKLNTAERIGNKLELCEKYRSTSMIDGQEGSISGHFAGSNTKSRIASCNQLCTPLLRRPNKAKAMLLTSRITSITTSPSPPATAAGGRHPRRAGKAVAFLTYCHDCYCGGGGGGGETASSIRRSNQRQGSTEGIRSCCCCCCSCVISFPIGSKPAAGGTRRRRDAVTP
jgi:hypothetical protein